MGRPLRDIKLNQTHHVFNRCIDSSNYMKPSHVKAIFLETISMAMDKYDFKLIAYSILDDHIHMLIHTVEDGETISRIIQFIKSVFARKFNKAVNRTGPVWNERFGDSVIEKSDNPSFYLLWLLWYIAYNAVRKKFVADPRQYAFCNIRSYLEEDYTDILPVSRHEFFDALGESFQERLRRFLYFEEMYRKRLFYIFCFN